MYVTVLMDVEDIVAEEGDDIARVCAETLLHEKIRATLCVVGEKARLLKKRGRGDVIAALKMHDIGVHTDLHSIHPTIAEYLGDRGWADGVEEAFRREKPGVEAIKDVFHMHPSCWGGPGNTWGPQICEAMRRLDVPAFVYAHTEVPAGGVHRFGGILAYPNGRSLDDGAYQDQLRARENREALAAGLQEDIEAGLFWQQIFVGHPTRILHEEFWDAPNFALGNNPPPDDWKPARRKSEADLKHALNGFRTSLRFIRGIPGIELRTIREMNAMVGRLPAISLSPEEQQDVWPTIEKHLIGMKGWPILPSDFDVSGILRETRGQLSTLERLRFPIPSEGASDAAA